MNIEVTNTEDIEGMIQAIINKNKDLTESSERSDWELIGTDLKELQGLIESLEKMVEKNELNSLFQNVINY